MYLGFWVVTFVIVTAIFSCCGYYCSSSAEGGRYGLLRSDSFNVFHRFRRFSSREYIPPNEAWKVCMNEVFINNDNNSTAMSTIMSQSIISAVIFAVRSQSRFQLPELELLRFCGELALMVLSQVSLITKQANFAFGNISIRQIAKPLSRNMN